MTSNSISVDSLSQAKDNSSLDVEVANNTSIMESLGGDRDLTKLPHFVTTVGHLLVLQVSHLQSKLLGEVVVEECRRRSWMMR